MRRTARWRDWTPWIVSLGLFTFVGVVASLQAVWRTAGESFDPWKAFVWQLPMWWAWATLMPLIVLADRAARSLPGRGTTVAAHFVVGPVAVLLHSSAVVGIDMILFPDEMFAEGFVPILILHLRGEAQYEVLAYAGIVGAWYAFDYFRRHQRERLAAAELEAELARAEAHALESRLRPHFLFNALQAIVTLNRRDPSAAERMLMTLADLFHGLLASGERPVVSLAEELALLELYVELEKMRFRDRLEVTVSVEPDVTGARVPRLILQPLVENAIRHGIVPKPGRGTVSVRGRLRDSTLLLEVLDDGVGIDPRDKGEAGLGLELTEERLDRLYGDRARLEVSLRPEGGTRASVTLPFEPEAA